jgi:hypothetical protein
MLTKLMSEVLDKLDVFVLEVEELFVPKVCTFYHHRALCYPYLPNITAPDMGMAVALVSSSHLLRSVSLQALQPEVCQAVSYRYSSLLFDPCPVGHGAPCGGLLPVHHRGGDGEHHGVAGTAY